MPLSGILTKAKIFDAVWHRHVQRYFQRFYTDFCRTLFLNFENNGLRYFAIKFSLLFLKSIDFQKTLVNRTLFRFQKALQYSGEELLPGYCERQQVYIHRRVPNHQFCLLLLF